MPTRETTFYKELTDTERSLLQPWLRWAGTSTKTSASFNNRSTRRQMLQYVGLGSAAMLAGCAEDDPATPDSDNGEAAAELPVFSTTTGTSDPSRIDFNAYHLDHSLGEGFWSIVAHNMAHRSLADRVLIPDLIDWEMVEPDVAYIHIRDELDGLTWYNGDLVTAEDLKTKFVLEKLADQRPHELIEAYEVIDDHTCALHFTQPVNPESIFESLATTQLNCRSDIYEEWVEWAIDSEYDVEVLEDLHEFNLDEPTGNGPWKLVDRTSDKFFFEIRDDHPWSDRFNWEELEYVFTPQTDIVWQRVVTDNTTLEHGRIPGSIVDQVPDNFKWYHAPTRFGMVLSVHYDVFPEHLARKAVAYALDGDLVGANTGLPPDIGYVPVETQTGLYESKEILEDRIGDIVSEFEEYNPRDTEHALSLLDEAGYEYDGDTLYYPGGDDPVTIEVHAPTFLPFFIPAAETVIDQLGEVGIEGSTVVQEPGGYFTDMALGDFGGLIYYTGSQSWIVGQQMTWNWWQDRITRPMDNGIDLDAHQVPWPPGDPDGELRDVNIREHILNLETPDEEQRRESLEVLTWAHNQTLPHYVIIDGVDTLLIDESQWSGPDEDDPLAGVMSPTGWARHPMVQARVDD